MQIIATKDYSVTADETTNGWFPAPDAPMSIRDAMDGARRGEHFVVHKAVGLGKRPDGRVFALCVIRRQPVKSLRRAA